MGHLAKMMSYERFNCESRHGECLDGTVRGAIWRLQEWHITFDKFYCTRQKQK